MLAWLSTRSSHFVHAMFVDLRLEPPGGRSTGSTNLRRLIAWREQGLVLSPNDAPAPGGSLIYRWLAQRNALGRCLRHHRGTARERGGWPPDLDGHLVECARAQ